MMDPQAPELMARRRFLKLVTAIPVLGALVAVISPLLRFLKPNVEKFKIYAPTTGDTPKGQPTAVAALREVANPWDSKYFVFMQKYPQYTPEGFKAANVPGVVVRLPYPITLFDPATGQGPLSWAKEIGKTPTVTQSDIIIFSRICPHLGCIYNYVANYKEVTAGYGGYVPPPARQHALIACPRHLTIYHPPPRQNPRPGPSGAPPPPPPPVPF